MNLDSEFYRLPLQFDADKLREEALQFSESAWSAHPSGFKGNSALVLVSVGGTINDLMIGSMSSTQFLSECPYIRQVFASFNTLVSRARLMRLAPGCDVEEHCDYSYHWTTRTRIHIPIITDPNVTFYCEDESVNMKEGEAWTFDNWRIHRVENRSDVRRIHLVMDTVGSSEFWGLVGRSWVPGFAMDEWERDLSHIPYESDRDAELFYEKAKVPTVMSAGEVAFSFEKLKYEIDFENIDLSDEANAINDSLLKFQQDWRCAWLQYGDDESGWQRYEVIVCTLLDEVSISGKKLCAKTNNVEFFLILENWIACMSEVSSQGVEKWRRSQMKLSITQNTSLATDTKSTLSQEFDRPVFIVSAPCSGSRMLFDVLSQNQNFWSVGDAVTSVFESISELSLSRIESDSSMLQAKHATESVRNQLATNIFKSISAGGKIRLDQIQPENRPPTIRFLDNSQHNALRIQFLLKLFPNALFVYLHRPPQQNILSIMEAWLSGRFVTYPELPDWKELPWSLILPPGWQQLRGKSLEEIAVYQWCVANNMIIDELSVLPKYQRCIISYDSLLNDLESVAQQICAFTDVPFGPIMKSVCAQGIPLSKYMVTKSDNGKCQQYEAEINKVISVTEPVVNRISQL